MKKPTSPQAEASQRSFPEPDELARLAAVVLSNHPWDKVALERKKHTKTAVQIAALLWLRANECSEELKKALASETPHAVWGILGDIDEAREQFETCLRERTTTSEEKQILAIGNCEENSRLLDWFQKNGSPKDRFKTYDGMLAALKKRYDVSFDPKEDATPPKVSVADAKDFLRWRNEERTKAKRAQPSRAKTLQGKSLPDKLISKADSITPADSKRRTSRKSKRTK